MQLAWERVLAQEISTAMDIRIYRSFSQEPNALMPIVHSRDKVIKDHYLRGRRMLKVVP